MVNVTVAHGSTTCRGEVFVSRLGTKVTHGSTPGVHVPRGSRFALVNVAKNSGE